MGREECKSQEDVLRRWPRITTHLICEPASASNNYPSHCSVRAFGFSD